MLGLLGTSHGWSANNTSYMLQADPLIKGVAMMHHLTQKWVRNQYMKVHNSDRDQVYFGFKEFGKVYDDGTGLRYTSNPGKIDI